MLGPGVPGWQANTSKTIAPAIGMKPMKAQYPLRSMSCSRRTCRERASTKTTASKAYRMAWLTDATPARTPTTIPMMNRNRLNQGGPKVRPVNASARLREMAADPARVARRGKGA